MTDAPAFDAEAVKDAAEKALIYAILAREGKADDACAGEYADAMETIVHMGPRAVHVALSGWCGLTLHGFAQDQGETPADGFWCLEVEDVQTGETVSIDEADNPAIRDAMRIVTCYGNNDHATIAAIVETAWKGSDEGLVELMFAAVDLAAQTAQHLRAIREGEG